MELPQSFVTRTRALLGDAEYIRLESALEGTVPPSLRINPEKMEALSLSGRVPWSRYGYCLPERLHYTFDPLFHAGGYYVQEASSMFLEQVLAQYVPEPVRYLDLCAAPGGKATHALSVLPAGSLVVANEVVPSRAAVLAENVQKWGCPDAVVTRNEPAELGRLTHFFDVVGVDAPCSGEGMFRKDNDSIGEWSEANVRRCADRQRQIVTDVWEALRPGGLLIYSTCTYNREENEETVAWVRERFGAEILPVSVPADWNVAPSIDADFPLYRFFPHRTHGEGFCLAVLRKPEGASERTVSEDRMRKRLGKRTSKQPGRSSAPAVSETWLRRADDFRIEERNGFYRAIPRRYEAAIALLESVCNSVYAGIGLGSLKGRDIQPHPALALSRELNSEAFPVCELSLPQALAFLRREALPLAGGTNGYRLMCCDGLPLGWAKQAGDRANNLYPPEWRIRSGFTPDPLLRIAPYRLP